MVDESALTGESLPVAKSAEALAAGPVPLAERNNMVYRATTITGGSGIAAVVATGRATQLGRIQTLLGETGAPPTPLQKQLDVLGRRLVALSAPVCGTMLALGVLRGRGVLANAQGEPASSSPRSRRASRPSPPRCSRSGYGHCATNVCSVRRLHAVEALGAVQTVCLDKTGTLTVNRMRVVEVMAGTRHVRMASGDLRESTEDLRRLISLAVLCNDARIEGSGDGGVRADPRPRARCSISRARRGSTLTRYARCGRRCTARTGPKGVLTWRHCMAPVPGDGCWP